MSMFRARIALLLLALFLSAGAAGCSYGSSPQAGPGSSSGDPGIPGTELTVTAFSAGAADAFLLTTDGSAVLIDCGEKKFGKELAAALEERNISRLDVLVISHFDKDHVGGAAKVIQSVPVRQAYQSGLPKDSSAYEKYLEACGETGLVPRTVQEELAFSLDGIAYRLLPPPGIYEEDQSNNSSLFVEVVNGQDRLLFLGDAEEARIRDYLDTAPAPCDFLKVPHHGRMEDNSAALFRALRPSIAVITSSGEEPEDAGVLALLEREGARVFLTRQGAVSVRSTGHGLSASQAT